MGLLPDLCVIVVHPFDLGVAQERGFDQFLTKGSHGNVFKAQPWPFAEAVRGLHLASDDDI